MAQFGWNLDLKRCVGCHACAVACKAENNTEPRLSPLTVRNGKPVAVNYRFVHTVDGGAYPTPTRTFMTMGCHHCEHPACLASCPVGAISKLATADKRNGLVLIDQSLCIGCRYCQWACPYGAPQFNEATGKVEKCTGCQHRLAKDLPPACATTCSGNALNWTDAYDLTGGHGTPPTGFGNPSLTNPAIKFL